MDSGFFAMIVFDCNCVLHSKSLTTVAADYSTAYALMHILKKAGKKYFHVVIPMYRYQ
jgi:hypothetical protein